MACTTAKAYLQSKSGPREGIRHLTGRIPPERVWPERPAFMLSGSATDIVNRLNNEIGSIPVDLLTAVFRDDEFADTRPSGYFRVSTIEKVLKSTCRQPRNSTPKMSPIAWPICGGGDYWQSLMSGHFCK